MYFECTRHKQLSQAARIKPGHRVPQVIHGKCLKLLLLIAASADSSRRRDTAPDTEKFMGRPSPAQTGPAAQIHKGNDIMIMSHQGGRCRGKERGEGEAEGKRQICMLTFLDGGKSVAANVTEPIISAQSAFYILWQP